jgi:flagellar biogenesis protein FliO
MMQVSFPLYTLLKAGPDSVIDKMSIGAVINSILFFLVLFLVYFLVRRVTKSGQKNLFSQNMRIVEKIPMGWDRSIMILELDKVYYVLYIDKSGATLLDKRDDLSFDDKKQNLNFKDVFSKWTPKMDREQDESDDK